MPDLTVPEMIFGCIALVGFSAFTICMAAAQIYTRPHR
jgi:hypothetical protein